MQDLLERGTKWFIVRSRSVLTGMSVDGRFVRYFFVVQPFFYVFVCVFIPVVSLCNPVAFHYISLYMYGPA